MGLEDLDNGSVVARLRASGMAWGAAMLLPIPVLAMTDPASNADVACLYLGLASAWLATEIFRAGGLPRTRAAWLAKTGAVALAVVVNVAVFVGMGLAAGVRSHLPFPVMALLAATPAVGLVPWLVMRLGNPYGALLTAAVMLLAAKLAACVAARAVYGPDFQRLGAIAADWRTAKLMISLFWGQAVALSLFGLVAGYGRFDAARATSSPPGAV